MNIENIPNAFCLVLVCVKIQVVTCWLLDCGYSATKQKRRMKKKTVTIIHSATTETVRLPDDNTGVSSQQCAHDRK